MARTRIYDYGGVAPRGLRRFWTLLVGLSTVAAVLFLTIGTPTAGDEGDHVGWKLLVAVLFLGTTITYSFFRYVRQLKRSHARTKILTLDDSHAYELQRRAGWSHDVNAEQAKIIWLSIMRPQLFLNRVTEDYEPGQRTFSNRVTLEGQIPEWALKNRVKPGGADIVVRDVKSLLVPILAPHKGLLHDNFEAVDDSGEPLSVLTYAEYLEVIVKVLRTLLKAAYSSTEKDDLPFAVKAAEHMAIVDILRRGSARELAKVNKHGADALRALKDGNHETYTPPVNVQWLDIAASLVDKLTERFAIIAAVRCTDDAGRFRLRYHQTIIPNMRLSYSGGLWERAKGRARVLLGARPVDLQVSLQYACLATSYHLHVHSEASLYLSSQDADDLLDYLEKNSRRSVPPYFRFQKRLGQSYAHFYTRFFPAPAPDEPVPIVRFRFFEKPPGSTFRAALAALVCFMLVWLVGFIATRSADPKTDAPAFLLVVPALAAAMMGFDSPSRRLLEGTLAARMSLLLTTITSIAASGLYLIYWTRLGSLADQPIPGPFGVGLPKGYTLLFIDRLDWGILAIISLFNFIYISYTYLMRSWEFTHMSTQHVEGHLQING